MLHAGTFSDFEDGRLVTCDPPCEIMMKKRMMMKMMKRIVMVVMIVMKKKLIMRMMRMMRMRTRTTITADISPWQVSVMPIAHLSADVTLLVFRPLPRCVEETKPHAGYVTLKQMGSDRQEQVFGHGMSWSWPFTDEFYTASMCLDWCDKGTRDCVNNGGNLEPQGKLSHRLETFDKTPEI